MSHTQTEISPERNKYRQSKPKPDQLLDDRRRVGESHESNNSQAEPQRHLSLLDLPPDTDDDWPAPLDAPALHGVAGQFTREVLPETEADEAALLFHFLTYAGAMFGRGRYYPVGGTSHHARLFSVAVGGTSSGRKGTALDCCSHVFRMVDASYSGADLGVGNLADVSAADGFCENNVANGLVSGSGLIWQLRDSAERGSKLDPGVDDKRLLVVESEFGGVLRVCQRKENDLSAVIRDAWDGKTLRTLAKQEPAKATDPHACFVGHITREELRGTLGKLDVVNGFANRILWYCVRRSKFLPDGGHLHAKCLVSLIDQIRDAVAFAQLPGRMTRSESARELWHAVYAELSSGRPGVFGMVTTRAEAQVLRLSMLYALLDLSNEIDVQHVEAALAVWKYCEASARWAFGSSLGNPVADELLAALREAKPDGMASTEISDFFNRNRSASQIRDALGLLKRYGFARDEKLHRPGQGRPTLIWYAT
jgi:hypothetical protein